MADAFRVTHGPDLRFEDLLSAARLEDLGKGRRGAVLVADGDGVPIVRTTTRYRLPAQRLRDVHRRLGGDFNNALFEHYTPAYRTMKRHSDQALDLAESSEIAVCSWYREPARPSRRLVVTPKEPGTAPFDIVLEHGGVVTFSLETNRRFTHAIVLREGAPDNDWLGLTVRRSKTFVRFVDGMPHVDGTRLTLATEDERHAFYAMRRRENEELDFAYPPIHYTLSESDLLPPA